MKINLNTEQNPVLDEPQGINHPKAALRPERVQQLSNEFRADAKNVMMQNAAHSADFMTLITNRDVLIQDTHVFNTNIPFESPVTDQKASGRCWIFAALNVFRLEIMTKYNLEEFELSQGYLFFWDKFEKCNWFLECMIDLRDREVTDRVVQHLLKVPIRDGGQWDMLVNLVERYGVVPKSIYPESFSSSNTEKLNRLVSSKLRDHAAVLRRMAAHGYSVEELRQEKDKSLKEIYNILAITLGEPPKQSFTWSFRNKDKKYFEFNNQTPLSFFKEHVNYPIAETVSIINDPRNKSMALYTVQYLGNITGGRPIRYINAPIEDLKRLAIAKLKSGKPVWFGADSGKFCESTSSVFDPKVFQYDLAFNISFNMTKAERLIHVESLMTHAMVFTGVHLDNDGKPIRWRVENSWGKVGSDSGYFSMSDAWFTEFVYQVVLEKSIVPQKFLDVLKQPVHVLPVYDPMGALA
ncbi:bleomycin hydrolase [Mortierella sp. GBAus27b]|nr:bleomycin hydrolase [Mortierella sp. GBAus27b]